MDFGKSKKTFATTSNDFAVASTSATAEKRLTKEKAEDACRTEIVARVSSTAPCMITEVKSIPMKRRILSCGICQASDIFANNTKKVWLGCGHFCHKTCFDKQFHLPKSWHCPTCGAEVEVMDMTKKTRGNPN